MNKNPKPEFSRLIRLEGIGNRDLKFRVEANSYEREAVAERLGLSALGFLVLEGKLVPARGGRTIRMEGSLRADLEQTCVVSLEPVVEHVDIVFSRVFSTDFEQLPMDEKSSCEEVLHTPDNADMPDPLEDDCIDVGEIAAEQLALEIDPYPRAAGAAFSDCYVTTNDSSNETTNPITIKSRNGIVIKHKDER